MGRGGVGVGRRVVPVTVCRSRHAGITALLHHGTQASRHGCISASTCRDRQRPTTNTPPWARQSRQSEQSSQPDQARQQGRPICAWRAAQTPAPRRGQGAGGLLSSLKPPPPRFARHGLCPPAPAGQPDQLWHRRLARDFGRRHHRRAPVAGRRSRGSRAGELGPSRPDEPRGGDRLRPPLSGARAGRSDRQRRPRCGPGAPALGQPYTHTGQQLGGGATPGPRRAGDHRQPQPARVAGSQDQGSFWRLGRGGLHGPGRAAPGGRRHHGADSTIPDHSPKLGPELDPEPCQQRRQQRGPRTALRRPGDLPRRTAGQDRHRGPGQRSAAHRPAGDRRPHARLGRRGAAGAAGTRGHCRRGDS